MFTSISKTFFIDKMHTDKNDDALKTDFLAAYHSVIFSKRSGDEIDVERRRLAVKYMTAKKFESENTAAILLSQGLKRYECAVEKTGLLLKINCSNRNNWTKWKTSLGDVSQAISLVKPLPCQNKSSDDVCGRRELNDRDVENLMKLLNDEKEEVVRKVRSTSHPAPLSTSDSQRSFLDCPKGFQTQLKKKEQPKIYRTRQDGNGVESNLKLRPASRNEYEVTEREEKISNGGPFRTAKAELQAQLEKKQTKKSLGGKASVNSKFVCPFKRDKDRQGEEDDEKNKKCQGSSKNNEAEDERLRGIDEKLIELVRNEIMDSGASVSWDDVAGLEHAKKIIKEIVVLPMLRPDIFTGLRRPPKGILLFGPPGTGKTLIGKCIASQSKSTFFSISASSLTSKWIGEGEKMVRALFAVARVHQPSVIFIDEIDSLLTQRSETEHESSRRIKTEFLVQLDGAATSDDDNILLVGATNRPQELDEAARRRFVKRLYVPLPDRNARRQIVENLLAAELHNLESRHIDNIADLSEHYSGADMTNLCKEASMGPIRSIPFEILENIRKEDVRCVTVDDFNEALSFVRPSVSQSDLGLYINWDRTYGSGTAASSDPS